MANSVHTSATGTFALDGKFHVIEKSLFKNEQELREAHALILKEKRTPKEEEFIKKH